MAASSEPKRFISEANSIRPAGLDTRPIRMVAIRASHLIHVRRKLCRVSPSGAVELDLSHSDKSLRNSGSLNEATYAEMMRGRICCPPSCLFPRASRSSVRRVGAGPFL
ncbi:MAG: hypothetical protein QOD90_3294 [Mycobacterium sp.]|nr:hypothetical protein [Mycobacterium sp.]